MSDPVFIIRRNPYYIGVDTAGNQLPYIDEVRFTYFADQQALNLAAIAGDFDMQARHILMTNYPVLKDQEKDRQIPRADLADLRRVRCGDRVQPDLYGGSGAGQAAGDKDFRVALSYAINRDEIKELVFLGLGEARQAVPAPSHPYFPARNGRRNTPSSSPTSPTRCWTRLA